VTYAITGVLQFRTGETRFSRVRAEAADLLREGELAWKPHVSPIATFVRTHHRTEGSSLERNHHSSQNTSGPSGRDYRSPAERGIWLLFNLAIDSKLRGCDVVSLKVEDVAPHGYTVDRATVRQRKTGRPVKFEITEQTRQAIDDHLAASLSPERIYLFQGRGRDRHLTTRQYARLLTEWLSLIGLDPSLFGTHSIRRTKATLIYRKTGNLRAVQLLLGHTKIESTVRYLGIEVDDALAIAEQVEV
jgi:integrase